MSLTIKELADFFGIEWTKEPGLVLERVSSFENAMPGSVTLATGTNRENLSKSQASAFIVDKKTVVPAERQKYSLLIAESPKVIFARTIEILHPVPHRAASIAPDFIHGEGTIIAPDVTIYPRVTVGKKCYIGERTKLYPGVVLGDKVTIGDDCILYPNVTVYDGTTIGNKVIIHGGAVIGSDGFGFAKDMGYTNIKIPHIGNVIIEDTVEIGANACIDRATIDSTIIGFGTKIDNLVHIAHNCEIGKNTLIAAQVGLSGSVKVGNHVTIAGQVGTNPRIEIGDSSLIAGQSGVSKSVAPGEKVSGTPIQSFREWKRNHAYVTQLPRKLPELESRIEALEKSYIDSSGIPSEPANSTKEHTA